MHPTSAAAGMPMRKSSASRYELNLLSLGIASDVSRKKALSSVTRHTMTAKTTCAKREELEKTSQWYCSQLMGVNWRSAWRR